MQLLFVLCSTINVVWVFFLGELEPSGSSLLVRQFVYVNPVTTMASESGPRFFQDFGFKAVTSQTPFADLLDVSRALGFDAQVDEGERATSWNTRYEVDGEWRARRFKASHHVPPLERFVDGAARISLLAHAVSPRGEWLAVVGGMIGAMACRIENERLVTEPEVESDQHAFRAIALPVDEYDDLVIRDFNNELAERGIYLLPVRPRRRGQGHILELNEARVASHTRLTTEMQRLERLAAAGPTGEPDLLTVVDGKLSAQLTDRDRAEWPMVGVVKRHGFVPLASSQQVCLLGLRVGERTPAFLIEPADASVRPSVVSWYAKIAGDQGTALNGTVRVEVSRDYLEQVVAADQRSDWIDGVSQELLVHRAIRPGYSREDCSLDPIVMLEDRLHAMFGRSDYIQVQLRKDLGFL